MEKANGETSQRLKKVMVFCDGTWCGQLTNTTTNVMILANAIAGPHHTIVPGEPFENREKGIVGCYYDGEGVEGDFSDYILDGVLGGKIKEDCLTAYRFIMDEFENSNGHCEAWLIGLSRGSYTVRCVGGMINNCGLISKQVVEDHFQATPTDQDMEDIIQRAYSYYRDRTTTYLPASPYMRDWKKAHSRETKRPPVKFMGLFETVGALGIPRLSPGTGVDYLGDLNFYGKPEEGASAVSGEVECVYQALAVHDRFSAFNPCHVKRDKYNEDFSYNQEPSNLNIEYKTAELWFPGAHYDIGRQKFMFFKSPKLLPLDLKRLFQRSLSFCLTRLLRIPDIYPNYEYADLVLEWMIKKMARTDPLSFGTLLVEVMDSTAVMRKQHDSLLETLFNWLTWKPAHLESDAYDHLVDNVYLTLGLAPFAHRFLIGLLQRYLLMDRSIMNPLDATAATSTQPRRPPGPPVQFRQGPDVGDLEKFLKASPSDATGLTYRSRSYDSYKLECEMRGLHTELVEE